MRKISGKVHKQNTDNRFNNDILSLFKKISSEWQVSSSYFFSVAIKFKGLIFQNNISTISRCKCHEVTRKII